MRILIVLIILTTISCISDRSSAPKPVEDSPIIYEIKNDNLKKELKLFYKTECANFVSEDSIVLILITRKPPLVYYTIRYEEKAWVLQENKNLFFAKMDDKIIAALHGEYEGYYEMTKSDLFMLEKYAWGVYKQIFPSQYWDYLNNAEKICNIYYNQPKWILTFKDGICIEKKRYI